VSGRCTRLRLKGGAARLCAGTARCRSVWTAKEGEVENKSEAM